MKNYNCSPLPFQGQKRRFLKEFRNQLQNIDDNVIVVDLFGGSGLLSHTVKQCKPNVKVVFNDYDNFTQRLNGIETTNEILEELRAELSDVQKDKRIEGHARIRVLKVLSDAQVRHPFVDWITISSNVLFSMNYAMSFEQLSKQTLYNSVRKTNYNGAGYLGGVEVVSMDYKELYGQYESTENVVYLVDPPYQSTDATCYNGYWKLRDYLDVLNTLRGNYFYFTSDKSQIIELCAWMEDYSDGFSNPFGGSVEYTVGGTASHNATYTDIMRVKYELKS